MVRLVLLLALLAAFPPLSTDMYLTAIPHLQALWQVPLAVINLTLVLFFGTYCVFLLFYGPLSDRFGRKPPLIIGIVIYCLGSFLCAMAQSVTMLIAARILQAAGAAAASAISMAIAKDRLEVRHRQTVLSYIAVIMALAPMIAPMIGSLIMTRLTWPWIFVFQGAMGLLALTGVILTEESHHDRQAAPVSDLVRNYLHVLSNGRFMGVVVCSALIGLPHFAFIAGSSTIYIRDFHLSGNAFALLFGANALCLMAGSMVCARFAPRIGTLRVMTLGYVGMVVGGGVMLVHPFPGFWDLTLPMGLVSFTGGMSRPPSNNTALEQVESHAGTASSTMIFCYFIVGALSMAVVSLDWADKIQYLACLSLLSGSIALLIWIPLKKHLYMPA